MDPQQMMSTKRVPNSNSDSKEQSQPEIVPYMVWVDHFSTDVLSLGGDVFNRGSPEFHPIPPHGFWFVRFMVLIVTHVRRASNCSPVFVLSDSRSPAEQTARQHCRRGQSRPHAKAEGKLTGLSQNRGAP